MGQPQTLSILSRTCEILINGIMQESFCNAGSLKKGFMVAGDGVHSIKVWLIALMVRLKRV